METTWESDFALGTWVCLDGLHTLFTMSPLVKHRHFLVACGQEIKKQTTWGDGDRQEK